MPLYRFAPLVTILLCTACLFPASARPGKAGRGQEPADKPAAPVPRKATLQEDRISLSKALQAFAVQTKCPARTALDDDPPLQLNLKDAGYWQALDTIARAAGARVNLYGGDGAPVLVKDTKTNKDPKQPVSHSGIFRIAMQRLNATLDYETGMSSYRASVEVAWEPHFLSYFLETRAENLVMHDANGNPVRMPPPGGSWVPVEGRKAFVVDLTLPALPRAADRIGLLKGAFAVRGTSRMLEFEFDTLDKLKADANRRSKKAAGVTVSVGEPNLGTRVWKIEVTTLLPDGSADFDSHQFWDVGNQIYLRHRDGKTRLRSTGYNRNRATSRKVVLEYFFEDTPQQKRGDYTNWRLVYRAPAGFVEVPVPFEFKNVRLP
ncbi:MAG: hypothetical protein HYS12_14235 [Planctomycetes bacterium]|nr:hypothetical protein [Planctomycetota bacterium]